MSAVITPAVVPPPAASIQAYRGDWQHYLQAAARIEWHQQVVMPGVLQVASYTHALVGAYRVRWSARNIRQLAEHRRTLREHLLRPGGAKLEFIIGEGALRFNTGGPVVMLEQLRFLLELPTDRVTIQVGSHAGGPYAGMEVSYIAAHALAQTVVYVEDDLDGQVFRSPHVNVGEMTAAFRRAAVQVLGPEPSRALIERIAAEFAAQT